MNFSIELVVSLGDAEVPLSAILEDLEPHREALGDMAQLGGELALTMGGVDAKGDYEDPVLRLVLGWMRKVPWIIGGDTETVALRNSEQCYAFVPAGDGVEVSFFNGNESEVEDYVIEPAQVMLIDFATKSIEFGERVLQFIEAVDPALFESDEDCRDIRASVEEARKAWHQHELRTRR